MKREYIILSIVFFSFLLIAGCGKSRPKKIFDTAPISIKQYDTPAGADPSVSAEMGGAGFKGEGWQTNVNYNTAGNPKAVKGGSLVISVKDYPATLRIVGKDNNSEYSEVTKDLLYETLLGLDPVTGEYMPRLATHWQISEDKMSFKFRINPDARWADGKPVTSQDVISTWRLLVNPETLDPYAAMLMNTFEQPVAESKYIVSVKSKEFNWRQFYYFSTNIRILPAHYIDGISGKDFLEKYQFKYIPGSGSYYIQDADIVKEQTIIARRRSDYWGEKEKFNAGINNFDFIKFVFTKDESLEYEKFKKGEIDVLPVYRSSQWQEKFEFDDVKRGLILKRKIFNLYPNGIQGLCINTRNKPFDDIRVRKAFIYAFNRSQFNEKLFYNSYVPMTSYFSGSEYENTSNPKTGFNLDSTKMLLAEAGWTEKNSEGYLTKDGKIFEVDLPFQKGSERYLTIYQEDLKKAGIKLNLKETDATTTFKLGGERNFSLLMINWQGLEIPNPESFAKSNIADEKNTTNWSGIKNKRIDELCDKYNVTFEKPERIKIIKEIDSILCNNFEYILMWYAPYQRLVFHNKFGYPDGILDKVSFLPSIPVLWFNDPEKAYEYDEAVKDAKITLPSGEVENKYWINKTRK
ncbi:MAG: ABC transporter substrate-binding protein [Ignavibacteria bacterium]|nr:ABC transporter substrate-binding protein [Ignavibacteria bacterium]